jgi:hypothetical protein
VAFSSLLTWLFGFYYYVALATVNIIIVAIPRYTHRPPLLLRERLIHVQPTRSLLENKGALCSHSTILHILLSILSYTTCLKFPIQNIARGRKVPKPSVAQLTTTKSSFNDGIGNLFIGHFVNIHSKTELLSQTVLSGCLLP